MITIVIADAHILINGTDRYSLDFEAYCKGDTIGIRHINQKDLTICQPFKVAGATLNEATYATALAFVYAFNSLTAPALAYLLTNVKSNTDSIPAILANTNYPNTPFSARITANAESHIANYAYPGYVTIKALSINAGNVYIGPVGLAAGSGELAPGESVAYEVDNLSTLYALNVATGYIIDVFGAYRQ